MTTATETTISDAELAALATTVVDARGVGCPGPLLEAKKAMGRVAIGDAVEVLSTDASTKKDIGIWATKVGHPFLGCLAASGYDRVFVQRGK